MNAVRPILPPPQIVASVTRPTCRVSGPSDYDYTYGASDPRLRPAVRD